MSPTVPVPPPGPSPGTTPRLQASLRAISSLQATVEAPHEYFQRWLECVVAALRAVGGSVWGDATEGPLRPVARCGDWELHGAADGPADGHARRARIFERSLAHEKPRIVPPDSIAEFGVSETEPRECIVIHCPVFVHGRPRALAEIVQPAAVPVVAQVEALEFLQAAARCAQLFLASTSCDDPAASLIDPALGKHATPTGPNPGVDEFLFQLHESLDLEATAYAIANEGRLQLGCDRVTLLAVNGASCRVLAISGVEQPDRRSNMVRTAEQLAGMASRTNEAIWYDETPQEYPAAIAEPLESFLEETTARTVGVVPLSVRHAGIVPPAVGVLILECFHRQEVLPLRERVAEMETQCAVALRNALRFDRVAWLRFLAPLAWNPSEGTSRGKRGWYAAAAVLLLLAGVLALARAELSVPARGELQPRERRDVFAPSDGIVEQVLVSHESHVTQGQPLVVIRDSDLEIEFRRVEGAIETARKRLSAVQALRLDQRQESRRDAARRDGQFSGEEEEIKEELRSLEEQRAVLQRRQDALTLRSPFEGQVLTWDVENVLNTRPVSRGQVLLTVARTQGPWELQLRIPEDRAGHVLEAFRERPGNLEVTFIVANRPETTFTATLQDVALGTELDETEGAFIPATAALLSQDFASSRAGTTVSARISCGRRSLGYVWLHDIYESLVARLWY